VEKGVRQLQQRGGIIASFLPVLFKGMTLRIL